METLLTTVEAGRRLGLGRTSVFALIKSGELEAVHLNARTTRVPASAVEAYIARLVKASRKAARDAPPD